MGIKGTTRTIGGTHFILCEYYGDKATEEQTKHMADYIMANGQKSIFVTYRPEKIALPKTLATGKILEPALKSQFVQQSFAQAHSSGDKFLINTVTMLRLTESTPFKTIDEAITAIINYAIKHKQNIPHSELRAFMHNPFSHGDVVVWED